MLMIDCLFCSYLDLEIKLIDSVKQGFADKAINILNYNETEFKA